MIRRVLMTLALLAVPALGLAQQNPHPYKAARLAACQGKSRGDACSFQGPNGTVNATCHINHENALICGQFHHPH